MDGAAHGRGGSTRLTRFAVTRIWETVLGGVVVAELEHLTGDVAAVLDLLPYRQMREEQPVG